MEFLVLVMVSLVVILLYTAVDFSPPTFMYRQRKAQYRLEQLRVREAEDAIRQQIVQILYGDPAMSKHWADADSASTKVVRFDLEAARLRRKRAHDRLRWIRSQHKASASIKAKLIWMLNGDRLAAQRLVEKQRFVTPGIQAEEDYWLQAIQDVQQQQQDGQ